MKKWTEKEIEYLKKVYPRGKMRVMMKKLGRSDNTIRRKAYDLGIKRAKREETPERPFLCWECKYATNKYKGYCSWSHELKPVENWKVKKYKNGKWTLLECPLFEKSLPQLLKRS